MNLRSSHMQTFALPFLLAASTVFAADPAPLQPGRYVNDGGALTIERTNDGTTRFELVVVSPWNGHTCGPMDGEVRHRRAIVVDSTDDDGKPSKCVVDFSADGDAIDVTATGDACSDQCGAAVRFEGRYAKLQPECDTPALSETQRQFKHAYDAKDYAKAAGILQPALTRCAATLDSTDAASLRNDLAITQYHLHDAAGCLRTLEPLREDADKTDQDLESSYPVFALELRLPAIRAARTNLKLCRAARTASPAR